MFDHPVFRRFLLRLRPTIFGKLPLVGGLQEGTNSPWVERYTRALDIYKENWSQHIAHKTLHTAHGILNTVHRTLHTAH